MKKTLALFVLFLVNFTTLAEETKLLDRYEESLQARIDLALKAKDEILVSTYAFKGDELGIILTSILRHQAKQGVKVKFLVDGLGSTIDTYLGTHLVDSGIEIEIFNPMKISAPIKAAKYRMHDKLFIVDAEYLIMGGRNSKNVYFGHGEKNLFKDRDVFYKGEIAREARRYYLKLFSAAHTKAFKVRNITSRKERRKIKKIKQALDNVFSMLEQKDFEVFEGARTWTENHFFVQKPLFIHDQVRSKKLKNSGTAKALMEQISKARSSVLIDSPYFILTDEWLEIFKDLRERKVAIRFLTNSLMATDGAFAVPQAGYLASKKKILALGIELYEYYTKETLHAKTMVIDNEIAIIGSFNFDPRSQNLNTEVVSVIKDNQMAKQLRLAMDSSLKKARKIMSNGKPEGSEKEFPKTKRSKIIATKLIQYLIYPIFKNWF